MAKEYTHHQIQQMFDLGLDRDQIQENIDNGSWVIVGEKVTNDKGTINLPKMKTKKPKAELKEVSVEDTEKFVDELKSPDESRFRLNNQKLLLTYKHHLKKETLTEFLTELNPKKTMKKIYIAWENGDKVCPYEHTHVVLDWGNRVDKTGSRVLDIHLDDEIVHPNIKFISNMTQWRRACSYLTKEDKSVVLDEDDKSGILERIWKHDNISECLADNVKTRKDLRDVMAIKSIFDIKPIDWGRPISCAIESVETMFPYQREIYNYIMNEEPSDRNILWIWDPTGRSGKRQLELFCELHHPEVVTWVGGGTEAGITKSIIDEIETGWRGRAIIIDLPKSATHDKDISHIYRLIERLKDGKLFHTKYQGKKVRTPPFTVVVLSNECPDRNVYSEDRLIIKKLTGENGTIGRALVTLKISARPVEKINPMGGLATLIDGYVDPTEIEFL